MQENFEQNIPIGYLIIGFIALMVISHFIKKFLRDRHLKREGQVLTTKDGRVLTPEERTQGNPEWASGEIKSKGKGLLALLWISAVALNLMLGAPFIKALSNPAMKTAPTIVLGVLTLFALGFTVFAIRFTWRQLRFGESRCYLEGKAGVLGQKISGYIRTNKDIPVTGDYAIEIQCLEHYHVGTGKKRQSKIKSHYQSTQKVPHIGKNSKLGIPFSIDLPKYPPETGYQISRGQINWQLKISAPVEGIDYMALFIVPVFKIDYTED